MEEFLRIALSFPTLLLSISLAVLMVLWLITALGIFQLESLDGWALPDSEGIQPEGFGGMLLKLGLNGVPLMVVLTLVVLFAWILSYFVQFLLLDLLPWAWLRWVVGMGAMLVALVAAVLGTALVLRPFRHAMSRLAPTEPRSLIGVTAIVRSAQLTPLQGRVDVADGGAGLILNARASQGKIHQRGDAVVLIEYFESENAYRVVGEDEFQGR